MLKEVDTNIWVAEQKLKYLGLQVGTRMTIIRLNNGVLVVISPIKIDKETNNKIDELGKVNIIIAPNLYHHVFISDYKSAYATEHIIASLYLDARWQDINC